jgi:hypothetical protein
MGQLLAIPFCLKFSLLLGASQVARTLAFACCVRPPCWRFFIKTPTQNLNLLTFAKTLVTRSVNSFCVAGEVSEGTSEFTFLVTSFLNEKEVTRTNAAALWRRLAGYTSSKNFSLPLLPRKKAAPHSHAMLLNSNYFLKFNSL